MAAGEDQRAAGADLRVVLEAVADVAVMSDARRRVLWINAAAERLIDFAREAVAGRAVDTLFCPDGATIGDVEGLVDRTGRWDGRCTHIDRAGRRLALDLRVLRVEGGDRLYLARDVTAQAEALAALGRSEANLRAAQRIANVGSYAADLQPPYHVHWSDELYRIFGWPPEAPPPSAEAFFDRLVHPEDRARVVAGAERVRRQGRAFEDEYRVVRLDGAVRWVHVLGAPEHDLSGRVCRIVGAVHDVTDRKLAQLALEESRRFAERVAECVPVAIYVFDVVARRNVYMNPAGTRIFGYSQDELREMGGSAVERLVHPDDLARLQSGPDIFQRARDDEIIELEYRIRRGDGRWRTVCDRNIVFHRDPDGAVRQILGSVQDVTGVREAEAELARNRALLEERVRERTRELQSLNAQLEAFSYSVSHDLRAPLRAMASNAEIVLEEGAGCLDEEASSFLRQIIDAAVRMNALIDGLMRLGLVSRAPLEAQEVDLSALAREIIDELRESAPARRVEVRIADHVTVRGDPALLRVMLTNLLDNAWKYTRERDGARIEFGRDTLRDGATACFVRDNGAGFDPEDARLMFQAFRRLPGARRFEGTGIGLATVAQVVRRHGGRIWATGAPDQGATFWFTLPDR